MKSSRPLGLSLTARFVSALVAITLASCGGDDPDASENTGGGTPTTPTTSDVTLAGVVSTGAGAASANSRVATKCAAGTGSVTTNADGSYRLTVTAANLPCLLEALTADGSTLHSVAPGTGTNATVTANITPFTELVVANLGGTDTSSYYGGFGSTAAAAVTATGVANAAAAVTPVLASAGVNTSTLGNVLTAPFDSTYTTALGTLNSSLTTGGVTLATLSNATATSSGSSSASSSTPSLPAELLLRPQASNCSALRSGSYRWILYGPSANTAATAPVTTTEVVSFNAQTLTLTYADSSTSVWTADGACRYTAAGGAEIVVSQAGVVVARTPQTIGATTTLRLALMFAEQSHPLSELAGVVNTMGWDEPRSGGNYALAAYTLTFDAAGALIGARCDDIATVTTACTPDTSPLPRLSINTAGGFDLTSTDPANPYRDRAFAYRAGNGDLLVTLITTQGEPAILTKDYTQTLPTVGTSTVIWNIEVNPSGAATPAIFSRAHSIASVDATAGRYTRTSTTVGTNNTRPETFAINTARNGYNRRFAATETAADGSTVNVREMYTLPLRGMGLTMYGLPNTSSTATSNAIFGVSIAQP